MKSSTFLSVVFMLLGLFSANVSASDKVVHAKEMFRTGDNFIRVSYGRIAAGAEERTDLVVVVNKLKTYWLKAPYSDSRIRITVPVRYYLSSWDVKALELELERLGVKVKPRPVPPKPAGLISG